MARAGEIDPKSQCPHPPAQGADPHVQGHHWGRGQSGSKEGNGEVPLRLTLDPAQVSVAGESRVCAASLRLT